MMKIDVMHFEQVPNTSPDYLGRVIVYLPDLGMILAGIRAYKNHKDTWIHVPALRKITNACTTWEANYYFKDEEQNKEFLKALHDSIFAYLKERGVC